MGKGGGEVALLDLGRELGPVAGADRVDEVLVVGVLDARGHVRVAARARGRRSARPLLVLAAEVGLPAPPVAVDPDPALAAVEQVPDLLRALVVGVDAAGGELEYLAVRVGEDRRVHVRRLLRTAPRVEEPAPGGDLHG